jgi:hypothetical protein
VDNVNTKTIPVSAVADIKTKIEKLNLRAGRLGLDTRIDINVLTDTQRAEKVIVGESEYGEPLSQWVEVVDISYGGESPRLNGWKLVAVLSPFEGSVLIETVPGETVDPIYRNADPSFCMHCKLKRLRSETFVLEHEDGSDIQVGRSCLKDFLGHPSPESIITWGELLAGLEADTDYWAGVGMGSGERVYPLDEVLVFVAQEVRNNGWVSRGKARDMYGVTATADAVMETMEKSRQTAIKEQRIEDHEIAERVLLAAQEQLCGREDLNDYEHNLSVLVCRERPIVTRRTWGIGCSVIAWYQNQQERLREKSRTADSVWIGEVGDKVEVKVHVDDIRYIDSIYGTTCLFTFTQHDTGNVIKWFGSGKAASEMEAGKTYTIKGTIKKLDTWHDVHQTVLTRVKVK